MGPNGDGGVIVMLNMNPAKPTHRMDNYLSGLLRRPRGLVGGGDGSQFSHDWDQILTLPRRLTLRNRYEVDIEPAGDIASLRYDHRHIGRTVITQDREVVLEDIRGDVRGRGSAVVAVVTADTEGRGAGGGRFQQVRGQTEVAACDAQAQGGDVLLVEGASRPRSIARQRGRARCGQKRVRCNGRGVQPLIRS